MPDASTGLPEYRSLLLGLLLVLGALLWPAEASRGAEAPQTASAVLDEAPGTWPAATAPTAVEAGPEAAPVTLAGED